MSPHTRIKSIAYSGMLNLFIGDLISKTGYVIPMRIVQKYKHLYDNKIGKLTYRNKWKKFPNGSQFTNWIFVECECGENRYICPRRSLKLGDCGCGEFKRRSKIRKTHGYSNKKIYSIYRSMLNRCYTKSTTHYNRYGGRGIGVCAEWRDSFESFLRDMGDVPFKGATLDRIDNNSDYSKSNCRWASMAVQCNNRSSNRMLYVNGVKMSVSDASRKFNICSGVIISRLNRGWSDLESVSKPVMKKGPKIESVIVGGKSYSLTEAEKLHGIGFKVISKRIKRGWTHEDAVSKPLGTRIKN